MWRIIATLCLTAVAEFTPEQLDKMSSSIQTTADQLQDKVVSLSKEINPLTLKVSTAPSPGRGAKGFRGRQGHRGKDPGASDRHGR